MNKEIENIIKKNLPEKKEMKGVTDYFGSDSGFNQALSQIDTKLIADEVLKVVVENERQRIGQEMDLIWRDTHHNLNLFEQAICELQEDLLFNSSILEGEQSEHLSPNKENK